jgi:hypothetical protein
MRQRWWGAGQGGRGVGGGGGGGAGESWRRCECDWRSGGSGALRA